MVIHHPKKIIFVGSSFHLLKFFSEGNETEAVSSVSFLPALTLRFVPDLIVIENVLSVDLLQIRKTEHLASIPVLICEEDFSHLSNLNSISHFSFVILCNECVVQNKEFISHLNLVMEKKRPLLNARTASVVKYAVLFLNKNISKKLSRHDFASQLGVNESYLSRIFKNEMGISLWNYVTVFKLQQARKMLVQTGASVKMTASAFGFESDSYFVKAYKKEFGISPGKSRSL